MQLVRLFRHKFWITTSLLVVLALLATTFVAEAAWDSCQGDPIVVLSNGAVIQMTVGIATDAANVQQVVYTVHAPIGTSVVTIAYTGGGLQSKEVVNFNADLQPGSFTMDIVALVSGSPVPMIATTSVVPNTQFETGYTGQHLTFGF